MGTVARPRRRFRARSFKVPFRDIYCHTLRIWIAETLYEHVVKRLDP